MDPKKRNQPATLKKDQKKGPAPKQDSTSSKLGKATKYTREHEDTMMSDSVDENLEALEAPIEANGSELQLSQIMGKFTDISKDMLKSALEQLRPEFQQMADHAVTRAVELRDKRVQELQDELSSKEKDLKQCILEKKKLKEDGQKNVDVIEQKDREIKKLEREIEGVKLKLKRRESDLKKEQARASEEEAKRVKTEASLKEEIDKLRKELDMAKAQRGMMKAVKNLGELEIKKLKEREKELQDQLEKLQSQR